MLGEQTPKGGAACWPEFRTSLRTVRVIYKAHKGRVDLEFPKYGDRIGDLRSKVAEKLQSDMWVRQTGKSASIYIEDDKWKIDFTQDDFSNCVDRLSNVLNAVSRLCKVADSLNYSDLY